MHELDRYTKHPIIWVVLTIVEIAISGYLGLHLFNAPQSLVQFFLSVFNIILIVLTALIILNVLINSIVRKKGAIFLIALVELFRRSRAVGKTRDFLSNCSLY
ncbi:MAG: hypothetical protein DHS20C18_27680 [Saprospiraceae bacterium]|nr:MAG: hypothetical protein DHS20C18_27680 [Saprospiraceae bacterium]